MSVTEESGARSGLPEPAPHHGIGSRIRTYFLTGLVVAGPVAITIWLIWSFVTWVDDLVRPFIPLAYRPETYLPIKVPGFGLIIALTLAYAPSVVRVVRGTVLTVRVSYYDFGEANIIIALLVATLKAGLVAAFFMHLRFDSPIFGRLFWAGLILALLVYVSALSTFHFWSS